MHRAAAFGHEQCVNLLLAHGADPRAARTDTGETPLDLAEKTGHAAVVRILAPLAASTDVHLSAARSLAGLRYKDASARGAAAPAGAPLTSPLSSPLSVRHHPPPPPPPQQGHGLSVKGSGVSPLSVCDLRPTL